MDDVETPSYPAGRESGDSGQENPDSRPADLPAGRESGEPDQLVEPDQPGQADNPNESDQPGEPNKAEEKPWWDDPSLPWRHKPTRQDMVCWALIAVVGVYGIALLPMRAILIGWSPPAAAMITGGRASVVATGAWAYVHGGPIIVYWLVASLSLIKFSWVYWWAGHLWGTGIIDILAGQSARAKRNADRAVRVTNKFALLAIFLTFLPIPFPMPIVFAAIGAAGDPLKRFLPPVFVISGIFQAGYLALGWWIGEPAVHVVEIYAKYMWYVMLVILVVMIVAWLWRHRTTESSGS